MSIFVIAFLLPLSAAKAGEREGAAAQPREGEVGGDFTLGIES
jgi:hypothetical protein